MYISEFSQRTGLSIHTLRYYEKEGLLTNISRNKSGRRIYSETDLTWVIWIKRLKSTGMCLQDIKRFARLRALGDTSLSDRKIMLIAHAKQLKADICRLNNELDIVEFKIATYQEKENQYLT